MLRQAICAGRWYPADAGEVRRLVADQRREPQGQKAAIALLAPHAGYRYSGAIAAKTYAAVRAPEVLIVLAPNHTGRGKPFALWAEGAFSIQDTAVQIDRQIADGLLARCSQVQADCRAHLDEHSIELHLPLALACFGKTFSLVPLVISRVSSQEARAAGLCLADLISKDPRRVLLAISSDFSHGESPEQTERKDTLAIAALENCDPQALELCAQKEELTMCGLYPALVALHAIKALGGDRGSLVARGNSAQISANSDYIVGYAGLTWAKKDAAS